MPWFVTRRRGWACVGFWGAQGAGIRHAVWCVGVWGAQGALVRHAAARVGVRGDSGALGAGTGHVMRDAGVCGIWGCSEPEFPAYLARRDAEWI